MSRRVPRYLDAVLRHLKENPVTPGSVVHAEVRHERDCAHWSGRPCNCSPVIETGARVDRKHGARRGPDAASGEEGSEDAENREAER